MALRVMRCHTLDNIFANFIQSALSKPMPALVSFPGVSSLSEALANANLNLDQCAYNIAQVIKLTYLNT